MHNEILSLFDLSGRLATITGGAVNLGFDAACVLAGAGCDLVITSRDAERARQSAARLTDKFGVDVLPLALDQTEAAQVQQVIARAWEWKGKIGILVNNAGGGSGTGLVRPQVGQGQEFTGGFLAAEQTGIRHVWRQ